MVSPHWLFTGKYYVQASKNTSHHCYNQGVIKILYCISLLIHIEWTLKLASIYGGQEETEERGRSFQIAGRQF